MDAREAWLRFSEPCEPAQAPAGADCWVSYLVIEGMHCAACAFTVEAALLAVPGVQAAQVQAATQRAKVVWSADRVKPSAWLAAIAKAGYGAVPVSDNGLRQARTAAGRRALWRWLVAGFCMMQVMMYAYPAYVAGPAEIAPDMVFLLRWASWVLTLPVLLFACGPFFGQAWRDLRALRVGMDLPVALGMLITFVLSTVATFSPHGVWGGAVYYDSLTMFVFFLLTGRWLELRLRDRTAGALEALVHRLPDSVERQLPDGVWERVALHCVLVDDVVRVLPAQSFPADGVLLQGQTWVDEALLTGESHPQKRGVGDTVVAGSLNLSGSVCLRVQQVGAGTQFAQVVALMQSASLQKPRLAQLADRIAKPFLLGVLLLAVLSALWWWSRSPSQALMVAVSVLVVTCPCALSLATPAAMLAAAGSLARRGVLLRNLQALESLAQIDTLIFDKTGTLTQEGQRITQALSAEGVAPADALALAAALAQHSLHPFSRVLVQAHQHAAELSSAAGLPDVSHVSNMPTLASAATPLVQEVKEHIGQGLEGYAEGPLRLRLGNAAFCAPQGRALFPAIPARAEAFQLHLCSETAWLASWQLCEDVRTDALQAVQALQNLQVDVWLLSGDVPASVQRVAQQLGIAQAWGACTPQDKLSRLQAAQLRGARVAMVGDGLNDGPVLAGAHVSMAFGKAAPLAQSQSDLVVLGDRLLVVVQCVHLARQTLRVVRQNLVWAAVYNAVCVPLAVLGMLPAWLAGLGMALSALCVVLNALRLSKVWEMKGGR